MCGAFSTWFTRFRDVSKSDQSFVSPTLLSTKQLAKKNKLIRVRVVVVVGCLFLVVVVDRGLLLSSIFVVVVGG